MSQTISPYAPAILKLLRGVLYHDDKDWDVLLTYQTPVREHFTGIGLSVHVDEAEGYAYLIQPDLRIDEPDDGAPAELESSPQLPRLVTRTRLTYGATLLCVLLREELQNFDAREPDLDRLILTREQIQEMLQHFFREQADTTRLVRRMNSIIQQVVNAGFLRVVKSEDEEVYEVRRIIKAKISADTLVEIKTRLMTHVEQDL